MFKKNHRTSGLIYGPSHDQGGIGIVIKETGTHKEVEGHEYIICSTARFSKEIHEFNHMTNKEVLDAIHRWYGCHEFNPEIAAADFILCKLVVNEPAKHTRVGTVEEILNLMQGEKSCTVTNTSKDSLLRKGGPAEDTAATDEEIINQFPKLNQKQIKDIYDNTIQLIEAGPPYSEEAKRTIEKYEGRGSQVQTGVIDEGLVHQFYTPYIVCKKMWDLAFKYGFTGGNVLEPSCGTGRFYKYAPKGTNLFGFDLDDTNIKIAKALYPGALLYKQEFETAFLQQPNYSKALKKSWLPEMDLVIGNPPYGDYLGYFKTYMPAVYKRFEFLFIRLGLQTLKPGGLLVYIISQNLMNNGSMYNKMKADILELGTFVDAIRLPNGIFASTQVGTDIVIFKRK